MGKREKYSTRQKELLLDYLRSRSGTHVTAVEVCEHFRNDEAAIGKSTVYRHLESLVGEGLLNKYVIDGKSAACFEFVTEDSHHEHVCFHCKCEKCGKLIHLHCDELIGVQSHLLEEHRFRMDSGRTVFYGICETCGNEANGA